MKISKFVQGAIILGLFSYNVSATGGYGYDMNNTGGKAHPAVMFVLDVSGSMSGSPLNGAKNTITKAVNKLRPYAYLGLISFSGCDHSQIITEVPLSFGSHDRVIAKTNALYTKGATNIYQALVHTKSQLKNIPSGTCMKVILLSDGADSCGEGDVRSLTREIVGGGAACHQVNVISIGIGDWEGDVFEDIADEGNGEHVAVDDSTEVDEAVKQILEQGTANASGGGWGGDYSGTGQDEDDKKKPPRNNGGNKDKPVVTPQTQGQGQGQSKGKTHNGNN